MNRQQLIDERIKQARASGLPIPDAPPEVLRQIVDAYMATDEQLDEVFQMQQSHVDRCISNQDVDVPPQVIVASKRTARTPGELQTPLEYTVFAMLISFNTELEKKLAMSNVGRDLLRKHQMPVVVSLSSEAWLAEEEKPGERRKWILPEDAPNRLEGLIVVAAAQDGRVRHGHRIIQRDTQQRITSAEPWVITPPEARIGAPILGHVFRSFFQAIEEL